MAVRLVPSVYPTIQAAITASTPGDTIEIASGYVNESATVTVENLIFNGTATSTGIVLTLGGSIAAITLTGAAPIAVIDNAASNHITGNDGSNTATVTNGDDEAKLGIGVSDRLIVNYATAATDVTTNNELGFPGLLTSNPDGFAGSYVVTTSRRVSFSGAEHFTITTGSGIDAIYTGTGDDIISTGSGNDHISAMTGLLTVNGGADIDALEADLTAFGAITLNLQNPVGNSFPAGISISNIEQLYDFRTGAGNDSIVTRDNGGGLTDNDRMSTGDGSDTVTVIRGDDVVHMSTGASDHLIVNYASATEGIETVSEGGFAGFLTSNADGFAGSYAGTTDHNVAFSGVERFTITTGSGNDTIVTGTGNDVIDTGSGSDHIGASTGMLTVDGGAGVDGLEADLSAFGAITLDLQNPAGNSFPAGISISNIELFYDFRTGAGDDTIVTRDNAGGSSENNDRLSTADGSDTVTVVRGDDVVHLGTGASDRLIVNYTAATADIATQDGFGNPNGLTSNPDGFAGFYGFWPTHAVSFTGAEHFTITTGTGNDTIYTGTGNDIINTGSGNDFIGAFAGALMVDGGAGGLDSLDADLSAFGAITLNLQNPAGNSFPAGISVSNIEQLYDFKTGAGDDTIVTRDNGGGMIDNDRIATADGSDTVTVVRGDDVVHMGTGASDHLIVNFAAATTDINTQDGLGNPNALTSNADGYQGFYADWPTYAVSFFGAERFTITTGSGNDTIYTGNNDDIVHGGGGSDSIHGEAGADQLFGDGGDDALFGSGGQDFLSGGSGTNTLAGGAQDDTYLIVSVSDVVTENVGEGNDLVYLAVSGYTLAANVEILWLTGAAATGFGNNASGNTLVGNAFVNSTITGGTAKDLLVGVHTAAKTTMVGGAGDDEYVTFNSIDDVQESAAAGKDTIYAAVDFTLPVNVEILWLVGTATHATGNANGGTLVANNNVASTITGGVGMDLLVGAHDVAGTLAGGGGDDTYVVFRSGDTVTEGPGGGNDALYTTADFVLPFNVETLWLLGAATHATSNSSGGTLVANNNLASTLIGGSASDLLVGGHASVATMTGGAGNDTYVTFNTTDVIQETPGGGANDAIVTFVNRTIPVNVETMFLATEAGAINATGGSAIDTIIGNAFDNVIDGRGAADILVSGGGSDTLVFQRGEANGDLVTDFAGSAVGGGDKLRCEGYGTAAAGANLMQIDATHWQINSADGAVHDVITLLNGASVLAADFFFA